MNKKTELEQRLAELREAVEEQLAKSKIPHEDDLIMVHLTKNGFYADLDEIIYHPKAQRQIQELREWMAGKKLEDITLEGLVR